MEHAFSKGGMYDPVKDAWRPLKIHQEKVPRTLRGVWTGREFLAWGGINGSWVLNDGVVFDPINGKYRLMAVRPPRAPNTLPCGPSESS